MNFVNGSTKIMPMFLQSMAFPTVISMVHGSKKRFTDRTGPPTNDLDYTLLLFSILEKLLEPGEEGSVSTLPGSFKEFPSKSVIFPKSMQKVDICALEIEKKSDSKNLDLHLGYGTGTLGCLKPPLRQFHFLIIIR